MPNKGKKILIIIAILIAALAVTAVTLYDQIIPNSITSSRTHEPATFAQEGMQITLTDEFSQFDVSDQGFTAGYTSSHTNIFVLKESYGTDYAFQSLSEMEYAQLVISSNAQLRGATPTQKAGLTTFQYTAISEADGQTYSYLVVCIKGPDAFWMFEFSTYEANAQEMEETYIKYAMTICFCENSI